ncbi:phosphorylase superfamily protein [Anaeroplasma bactoclasticum]|jgi:purine-nucleoside phosphorylase/transcriptional regulator with XRE-family HTH domain|uniref:Phosphorylase superfamily protein n=1 Tax=Anaeroplasma bactoclasticum TaxID=2088 RepID=A0A397R422_9MOLU|nr:helix-turn-helix domain-containing protein [Anaeroplasma bactoclasticum]RIA64924.1 phosphorylase superfamily protein [Anaeroplasma bactoclasticum]
MTLGDKIKRVRLSKGLTLDDMAQKLGYSNRSAIYKIENGYGITLEKLKKIAEALDVPFEELIYDDIDYLDAKDVIKEAEKVNLIDDILYAVYGIHKETYYDFAIIAPSWYPEKVFNDEDNIILLKKASYNSSYEVYSDNLKIAYIQCGSGASNLTDCMLCLTNANINKIYFIGAVGSIDKAIPIASLVTPSKCISYDGVTPFFKKQFEKKMYGNVIIPYNLDEIDKNIELLKSNNIDITKEIVFCTDSILLEYSHMDEIKATGAKLIEMETAAFYSCLRIMKKSGMALLLVSDNSQDKKSLIEKTMDDKNKYNYVRNNIITNSIKMIYCRSR